MNFFEEELKKGVFQICHCKKCEMVFWPPQKKCTKCDVDISWKESSCKGKIIEFSKKDSEFFGLVEIDEGIRVLGKIMTQNTPIIGQSVKMNTVFENRPIYSFIVEKN